MNNSLPKKFYPNLGQCLIFTHKKLKQSMHITRHVEDDKFYLMFYDFDNNAVTVVKEAIHKSELFHCFTVLAPELFQHEAFYLSSREVGPATAGNHPEYDTIADHAQHRTFQYGTDEDNLRSFDAAVLANIPEELLMDPQRN